MKQGGKNNTKTMNAEEMLFALFPVEEAKDPFDEVPAFHPMHTSMIVTLANMLSIQKKVITKLRQMLDAEDFKDLFLDANIGDLY